MVLARSTHTQLETASTVCCLSVMTSSQLQALVDFQPLAISQNTNPAQCCRLKAPLLCSLGPCSKAVMDNVLSSDDPVCGGALTWPDNLILAVLEREHNLTSAKLHELRFERLTKETHVYHLRRLINLVGIMHGSHMCFCAPPLRLLFGCMMMPDNIAVPCFVPC